MFWTRNLFRSSLPRREVRTPCVPGFLEAFDDRFAARAGAIGLLRPPAAVDLTLMPIQPLGMGKSRRRKQDPVQAALGVARKSPEVPDRAMTLMPLLPSEMTRSTGATRRSRGREMRQTSARGLPPRWKLC